MPEGEGNVTRRQGGAWLGSLGISSALSATTFLGRGRAPEQLGPWVVYFPLIGLGMGAFALGADRACSRLAGQELGSVAALAVAIALSGGRPVLALARTLAALVPEPAFLRLQRVSALVLAVSATAIVLLELFCLVHLDRFRSIGLLFAPMLARCAMVVLAVGAREARADGRQVKFAPDVRFNEFALASTITFALVFFAAEFLGLVLVLATAALAIGLRVFFHRWLGGIDRTALDAGCEATQLVTLALLAAF